MIIVHGVLAPFLFVPMLGQAAAIDAGAQAVVSAVPQKAPQQVILVNIPVELLTLYALTILREEPGRTPPEHLQQLYAGSSALVATRIDENTLELQADNGWGESPLERIFGRIEDMPRPGETLKLDGLEIRVQERNEAGCPMRVQFRFPSALEAPERLFYVWEGNAPRPWQPPKVGQSTALAPLSFITSLGR